MKICIKNQYANITINSFGAYIEKFSFEGDPIFFPKVLTKIKDELKTRGGMHPCVPNFGKDEIFGLAQHGFGRNEYWEILNSGIDFIDLKLEGLGIYEDVDFYIHYSITGKELTTRLKIINNSNREVSVGPGFHPYFCCNDLDLKIDNFEFDPKDLEDTLFLNSNEVKFSVNGKDIMIFGKNINTFAIWTDYYGDYVCVEPTYKGKVFYENSKELYILKENEEFCMEFYIKIV